MINVTKSSMPRYDEYCDEIKNYSLTFITNIK